MMLFQSQKIYWGSTLTAYAYGAEIKQLPNRSISYKQELIPAGSIIQKWFMRGNYQGMRQVPYLPLLQKGATYRLVGHFRTKPAHTAYLRISYYNRYQEEIDFDIIRKESEMFTYPEEAFDYKIQLVSAGCVELVFDYLELSVLEKEEQTSFPTLTEETRTIILGEPRIRQFVQPQIEDFTVLGKISLVSSRQVEKFEDFLKFFEQVKLEIVKEPAGQWQFLGYGPLSNFLAIYLAYTFKGAKAVITSQLATDSFYLDYMQTVFSKEVSQIILNSIVSADKVLYDFQVEELQVSDTLVAPLIRHEGSLRFVQQEGVREP